MNLSAGVSKTRNWILVYAKKTDALDQWVVHCILTSFQLEKCKLCIILPIIGKARVPAIPFSIREM